MLRHKRPSTTALPLWSLLVLLALACCAGCGNKDSSDTPTGTGAPTGTASLPPQAQAAAQAQEKADAANRAAHAPH